jgi:protein tyrosine phosphatase (PTP) superfamily phosphohydrolase (DUF442 family)
MKRCGAVLLLALAAMPGEARARAPVPPDSAAVVALISGAPNAACPLPGVATAGQPDSAQLVALGRAGVRRVIDLRVPDEARGFDEVALAKAAKLHYVNLPVTAATLSNTTFDRFRRLMKHAPRTGVLVHCHSGNRVGAVMIPWLVLDRGWDIERAVTAAKAGGLKSPVFEEKARAYVAARARRS